MALKSTMTFEEFRDRLVKYAKMIVEEGIPALRHGYLFDVQMLDDNVVILSQEGVGFMVVYEGQETDEGIAWSRPSAFENELEAWWNKYRLYVAGYYVPNDQGGEYVKPQAVVYDSLLYYDIGLVWVRDDGLPTIVSNTPMRRELVPFVDQFDPIFDLVPYMVAQNGGAR